MAVFLLVRVLRVLDGADPARPYPPLQLQAGDVKASLDGGASFIAMAQVADPETSDPAKTAFKLAVPAGASQAEVHVGDPGHLLHVQSEGADFWPVVQKLVINLAAVPIATVGFDGPQQINVRNLDNHTHGADVNLEVNVVPGQLRDASGSITSVATPGPIDVTHFNTPILNPAGAGFTRLQSSNHPGVNPTGKLFFAERTAVPRLIAIYRPDHFASSLYPVGTTVPYHLFFHPFIPPDWPNDPYPFGPSYQNLIERYLVDRFDFLANLSPDGKEMIHQHADGGEKMIFVFPVGSKQEQMGRPQDNGLVTQTRVLRLLQEVNYWVQRIDGVPFPLAPVGRCALSCFSAGVRFLASVLLGPRNSRLFDTLLKEVYAFDGLFIKRLPNGSDVQSVEETVNFCSTLRRWLVRGGAADDRAIRVYTQRDLWFDQLKNAVSGATVATGPDNAKEVESSSSTVLFIPAHDFWLSIDARLRALQRLHDSRTVIPGTHPPEVFPDSSAIIHQWIPAFFMEHAIDRSLAPPAPTPPPPPPTPAPLTITTSSPLPDGLKGVLYTTTLIATGGTPPLTWLMRPSGSAPLPPGLTLSPAGVLSGTPPADGVFFLNAQVTDSTSAVTNRDFAVTIRKGCFIASAAYGSDIAPEVEFLMDIRENILRQMDWGRRFFDTYWTYYYRISPAIAEEMRRDPELQKTIRWSIVEPWTYYMKVLLSRPDWDQIDFDGLQPPLREFLLHLKKDMDQWLGNIELPTDFAKLDPFEAVKELNVILSFVRRTGGLKYLEELTKRGELPLHYGEHQKAELLQMLRQAGRTQKEIDRILYGERNRGKTVERQD